LANVLLYNYYRGCIVAYTHTYVH